MMTSLKMEKRKNTPKKRHMTKMSNMSTHQTGKIAYVATSSKTKTELTKKTPSLGVMAQNEKVEDGYMEQLEELEEYQDYDSQINQEERKI